LKQLPDFHETWYGRAISDIRREVDEICALLGYYAERSYNFLPTFRNNLLSQLQGYFIFEDGAGKLSRNVGKELPLLAE
jgi:hypothetical protein